MKSNRPLAILTLISITSSLLAPWASVAAAQKAPMPHAPQNKIVPFTGTSVSDVDWSAVDWSTPIELASEVTKKQLDSAKTQNAEDLQALMQAKPTHRLSDEDMLAKMNVPSDIQELVRAYRVKRDALEADHVSAETLQNEKQLLANTILLHYPGKGLSTPEENHVVTIKNPQPSKVQKIIPITSKPAQLGKTQLIAPAQSPLFKITGESFKKNLKPLPSKKISKEAASWWQQAFGISAVNAASTLIAYSPGIEKKPLDNTLYYLSTQQNVDGSFGETDMYATTFYTVLALAEVNRIDSDQYTAAVTYLTNTVPANNRDRALKARFLWLINKPFKTILDDVLATRNEADGGYGLDAQYASDALTTDEVALTYYLTDYSLQDGLPKALSFIFGSIENDGSVRYANDANASLYLINQTAQALYPMRSLSIGNGQQQVSVQSKIDLLLGYLKNSYDANTASLAGANRAVDTILTIRSWRLYNVEPSAVQAVSAQLKTQQLADGSFENSVEASADALLALKAPDAALVSLKSIGNLQNKAAATLELTIKNNGYDTLTTTTLWSFVDAYQDDWNITLFGSGNEIAPGGTAVVQINVPSTVALIGNTEIKLYLENLNDLNFEDNWITNKFVFLSAQDGSPAMPVYYIAQEYTLNNFPAINVRWPVKNDANRYAYEVDWREKGTQQWFGTGIDTTWNGAFIGAGFKEGGEYEIRVGVIHLDQITETYYQDTTFIKMSSDLKKYNGVVTGSVVNGVDPVPQAVISGYGFNTSTNEDGLISPYGMVNGSTAGWVQMYQYDPLVSSFAVAVGATTSVRIFAHLKDDVVPPVINDFQIRFKQNFKVKNQKTVELLATGSDNIALKEGYFYLWNPADQYWSFLGSQPANNNSEVDFKWDVPANLLGAGYKVKAVFYDYRGNASAAKEWGPFQILDGTTPVFHISSPAAGQTWYLNTTNTITWSTSSTNPVNTVSVRLVYPRDVEFVANGVNNSGSYTWKLPKYSSYLGNPVSVSIRGTDSINAEEGLSYSDGFTIADNSPAPAAPWSVAQSLLGEENASSSAVVSKDSIQVATDKNGVVHVIYRLVVDSVASSPRTVVEQLIHRTRVNGVWGAPTAIYENTFTPQNGSFVGYTPLSNLKLNVDALGHLHLVAIKNLGGSDCTSINAQEIVYFYFDGAVWSAPLNISNNATASMYPDIATDSSGNPVVTWLDGNTYSNVCKISGTQQAYVTKKQNGVWGAISILGDGKYVGNARVAVTPNNVVHVVYRDSNASTALETNSNGGNWSAPQTVFVAGGFDTSELASDSNGILHYVFAQQYTNQQGLSFEQILYSSNAGGGWSAPTTTSPIPMNGDIFHNPHILIDGNNRPHIFFEAANDNVGKHQLMWTMSAVPGHWLPAQAITPNSHYFNDTATAATIAGSYAVAAWLTNYSFGTEPFYSTADLSTDFIQPDSVAAVAVTTTISQALVTWQQYVDVYNDFDYFKVYRNTVSSSQNAAAVATISRASSTVFIDTKGVASTTYYYALSAVDKAGNESVLSAFAGPIVYPRFDGTVYEDAEDGAVNRWQANPLNGQGMSIKSVFDDNAHNQAIELSVADLNNQDYYLFKADGKSAWNDTAGKTLQFDLKTTQETIAYARVETTKKSYYIMYSFNYRTGLLGSNYASLRLDPSLKDGAWHTISRDLESDLQSVVPGETITSVTYFLLGSSNARVDNIMLINKSLSHHIAGVVADGNNQGVANVGITLMPGAIQTQTDQSGSYSFASLSDGVYTVMASDNSHTITPSSTQVVVAGANVTVNFVASANSSSVYENAEDGTVQRWKVNAPGGQNSIANVVDDLDHGKAIEIKNADINNYYYKLNAQDGVSPWNNSTDKTLQFDLKTNNEVYIDVLVQTAQQPYYLMYSFNYPTGFTYGKYISIHLDPAFKDGTWHTVTRNLATDLQSAVPGAVITSVNNLLVGSNSVRVDNVLLTSASLTHVISGTVTDNNNQPVSGVPLILTPGQQIATSDNNGNYSFGNMLPGTYVIAQSGNTYLLTPSSTTIVISNADIVANFTAKLNDTLVYEDAEDGSTGRWKVNAPGGQNSIANVVDDLDHGKAIEIKNADIHNYDYVLYKADGITPWNNTTAKTLQFDLKTNNESYAYAKVKTANGTYYLMYSFAYPTGISYGKYASFRLDPAFKDGAWHTVTRNLEADLSSLVPNVPILSVENFIFGSNSARVDNVKLMSNAAIYSIFGTVVDTNNVPQAGVTMALSPGQKTAQTDQNGVYAFAGLVNGTYTVSGSGQAYLFTPTSTVVVVANTSSTANFVAVPSNEHVYEDGEDGSNARWLANPLNGLGMSATNVVDDQAHNHVIEIITPDTNNQDFYLRDEKGNVSWSNTTAKTLAFDLKTTNETLVYLRVETANKTYYLTYSFAYPAGLVYNNYASIHLNPAFQDGTWHTITRDIQTDLDSLTGGTPIISVVQFLVGSTNARIDNVKLIK